MPTEKVKYAQVLLTYPQCERSKEDLLEWWKEHGAQCAIVSRENHHETEGVHLHAWIKFPKTMQTTKGQWGSLFDWEGIHGNYERVTCTSRSIADVVQYVTKDGDYVAWNCNVEALKNPKKSHERKYDNETILNTPMKELVEKGVIPVEKVPAIQRGIQAYRLLAKPGLKSKCRGIWLTGRAGCGKSTWAAKLGEHLGGYYEKQQNKWFDGYDGEKVIVLNDLDNEALLHHLKIWADKFPCKGEVKGYNVWLHHDWFVVTSNFTIREICEKVPYGVDKFFDAMKRRFHELSLPDEMEFFQFDPSCDWSNPDVESCDPPAAKRDPAELPAANPAEDLSSFSGTLGSGYD